MSDDPKPITPTTTTDPFADLPPMGTMQIGSPVSGTPPTTEPLPTAMPAPDPTPTPTPTPTPQPAPTPTLTPNTDEAKKKSKNIIIAVVVTIFCLLGTCFGIFLVRQLMGNKSVTCTSSYTEDGVQVNMVSHMNYSANHITSATIHTEFNMPGKVSQKFLKEYEQGMRQGLGNSNENTTIDLQVSLKDSNIIVSDVTYTYRTGVSYQESLNILNRQSPIPFTCKDD